MPPTVLQQIIDSTRETVLQRSSSTPIGELKASVRDLPPPRPFLHPPFDGTALIAEIKRASPSKGLIRPDLSPREIAHTYCKSGASAVSVLTEERFFLGHPSYIQEVRTACPLPILRKDFILDPWQVYETRALGADAMLLIATMLDPALLSDLLGLASELQLECLVEVHSPDDLAKFPSSVRVVGVNSRDLHSFTTDLAVAERLIPEVIAHGQSGRIAVAESGIFTRRDVERVRAAGASAVLVGEALMREADIAGKIAELLGKGR
ncbi:MAG: indole-3-glycerol phosphate synthase TrpC [Armatimonadota bacterium]